MTRPSVTKKDREKEAERVLGLSNRDLLTQTLELARGDDYDGDFTPRGYFTFTLLTSELNARLQKTGWLNDPAILRNGSVPY